MTRRHTLTTTQGRTATMQRGAILLITLVSLVILLLAATALLRSTNTAALIAGNLALRQSSVASSDRAVADAVGVLATYAGTNTTGTSQSVGGGSSSTVDPWQNLASPFNVTSPPYYSNLDPALSLTATSTWQDGVSSQLSAPDASGNQSRYIIQRMCLHANQLPTEIDCMLNYVASQKGSKQTGISEATQNPSNMVFRITVRTVGPRNTVSYTQAFVN